MKKHLSPSADTKSRGGSTVPWLCSKQHGVQWGWAPDRGPLCITDYWLWGLFVPTFKWGSLLNVARQGRWSAQSASQLGGSAAVNGYFLFHRSLAVLASPVYHQSSSSSSFFSYQLSPKDNRSKLICDSMESLQYLKGLILRTILGY